MALEDVAKSAGGMAAIQSTSPIFHQINVPVIIQRIRHLCYVKTHLAPDEIYQIEIKNICLVLLNQDGSNRVELIHNEHRDLSDRDQKRSVPV